MECDKLERNDIPKMQYYTNWGLIGLLLSFVLQIVTLCAPSLSTFTKPVATCFAANTIAIAVASQMMMSMLSHMGSQTTGKKKYTQCVYLHRNLFSDLNTVNTLFHIVPVALVLVMLVLLSKTTSHQTFATRFCISFAIFFVLAFVYLSVPIRDKNTQQPLTFVKKIRYVYLNPDSSVYLSMIPSFVFFNLLFTAL